MKHYLSKYPDRAVLFLAVAMIFAVCGAQVAFARINNDISSGGGSGTAYPFNVSGNATSTLTQFNGGLTAYASSTIGNGTQAGGLTTNGGATTTGSSLIGPTTLYPGSSLTVKTIHTSGTAGISFGIGDVGTSSSSPLLYSYKVGAGNTGAFTVLGLNYYLDNSGTGQKIDTPRNGWGLTTDTRTLNAGTLAIQQISTSAVVTSPFVIDSNGNVGVGTTTPASRLHVSSGASATTTVTIGELGLTTSKACVNMNRADGGAGSFYLNSAGVLVGEASYCK